ncbi:hypothetical protein CHS0354_041896 [Potamilus streckersoni]|uniref:Uncharacterized protein n=1 Tax=Potamilus streckersoni TaxID=2493646 RepID=A0AAE0ST73_9BIVA|nr:hypothetical protein CHS0354_041896 [Potamilus streckersoni]
MIMRCVIISILASLALVDVGYAMYNTGYPGYIPKGIGHAGYGGYSGFGFGGGYGSIIMIIILLVVILPLLGSISQRN